MKQSILSLIAASAFTAGLLGNIATTAAHAQSSNNSTDALLQQPHNDNQLNLSMLTRLSVGEQQIANELIAATTEASAMDHNVTSRHFYFSQPIISYGIGNATTLEPNASAIVSAACEGGTSIPISGGYHQINGTVNDLHVGMTWPNIDKQSWDVNATNLSLSSKIAIEAIAVCMTMTESNYQSGEPTENQTQRGGE